MSLHPVILAGGSGTRFWPLSRRSRPKQFLPLASDRPLLVDTFARLPPLARAQDSYVVCGESHAPEVRRLVPSLPLAHLLIEPAARNTAPAIGLAAVHVAHDDPQGVLVVLPSDHHIGDAAGFRAALETAASLAQDGLVVTLGVRPTRPDTGYGYIHLGERIDPGGPVAHHVRRFVEKPDSERAKAYLASGEYLWNAGIFVMRADVILREIARHLPGLDAALTRIARALATPEYVATLATEYPGAEAISIDFGVMEKAGGIACVPGDFGWSDVGSFAALPEVRPADAQGNVVQGEAVLVDCGGCVVLSSGRTVAAVGLRDLVIVDAGDALLVVPKDRAQDVRAAVDALGRRGATKVL